MPLLAVRGNGPAGAYGFGAASEKAAAMTAIASTTLSSNSATITFSSIPATYDDLLVVVYARSSTGGYPALRFNSDTGTNYSHTSMSGDGSAAASYRSTSTSLIWYGYDTGIPSTTNSAAAYQIHVLNYANTSYNKTVLTRQAADNNGSGASEVGVGLYRSTSAISAIELRMNFTNTYASGTVAALYGIKKAA